LKLSHYAALHIRKQCIVKLGRRSRKPLAARLEIRRQLRASTAILQMRPHLAG
jgi:hypothetical protein